jgi:hypothetical protein
MYLAFGYYSFCLTISLRPFQEQAEPYQYDTFNHSFDSEFEQYNIINSSFAQQQAPFYDSGITHSPQEYSYCPKLITFYNPDGSSTQISNVYLRLKVDLDLKIYWMIFTSERTFPIFLSDTAYSISTTRLLLHFTPRQIESRNLYRCDCLFSTIEEINHCFDTYSHFQSLAQTTSQGSHNLLYNNESLPYTPMPSYSQPFSQSFTATPEYDMSQYIGSQSEPSVSNIVEGQGLLNLPEINQHSTDHSFSNMNQNSIFTESTESEEKIDPLISQRAHSAKKSTITTLNLSTKGPSLSKPSRTSLPVDDLFHRVNRFSKDPNNFVDSGLQLAGSKKSDDNLLAYKSIKPTPDFTKTINYQNLHTSIPTSNVVQKSSLEFLTNIVSSNLSKDKLERTPQKNDTGFKKAPTNSKIQSTQQARKAHMVSELPLNHPTEQMVNDINKLSRTNANEEVFKKRKLSHANSSTSNFVKQNEDLQSNSLDNLIDGFASPAGDYNSFSHAVNSLGYNGQKHCMSSKPLTGTHAIKGKSARLTDEERMRARLERFSTQGASAIYANDFISPRLSAGTRLPIRSTGREELSSAQSPSTNYNPNFPVDQASVCYNRDISLSQYSQLKTLPTNSDAALSLLALNDKVSTSPFLFLPAVSQSTTRTMNSFVKASEGINDTTESAKKKSEKNLEATPLKSTAPRSSKDKHVKAKPAFQNSSSKVNSKSSSEKLASTQPSKIPIPSKMTFSTNAKQKKQLSFNDLRLSVLNAKIQAQSGVITLAASSKNAVSNPELSMKNSLGSLKTELSDSSDQIIGTHISSGLSPTASVLLGMISFSLLTNFFH